MGHAGSLIPTFYIASSIHNNEQTKKVAGYLTEVLGYAWANGHNWTVYSEADAPLGSPKAALLSAADVSAAVAADLFLLLRTNVTSHGAHAEFGARLAVGKTAHVVLQDSEDHLFYYHPCVIRHRTVEEFVDYVRRGNGNHDRRLF